MKRSLLLGLALFLTIAAPAAARCDNFDPAVCLQPSPNNYFTTADSSAKTGLKVNFDITDMPRNAANKPIDPTEWNRNDGFSPGSEITTYVPGLDLKATGGVPINHLEQYTADDAPIVVIDTTTRKHQKPKRWPIWTEMDTNASSPQTENLIVRPALNFKEGHTYVVALRNLKDKDGKTISAGDAFAGYRDGKTKDARTADMERIFKQLAAAGVTDRKDLFLAWDFTAASRENLSDRMLSIRNDAFKQLGDTNLADLTIQGNAPAFKVSRVEPGDASHGIARVVYGNFKVPCYISTPNCVPGGGFIYSPGTDQPLQLPGNTYTATFRCNVPTVALSTPGTASLYGHGLFGSEGEVGQWQLQDFGSEHDYVFCGTTWAGMGCPLDVPDSPDSGQTFLQNA